MTERIAIIGGGIAGLTAAYLLHRRFEITLYEKESRLGGNAYTFYSPDGDAIDISVFAFSKRSYPNFFRLLGELGVETSRFRLGGLGATSYDIDTHDGYAFAPLTLRGLLPSNVRRTRSMMVAMRKGVELLDAGALDGLPMAHALPRIPELSGHVYRHFVFMLCLASSMAFDELMRAPAAFCFAKVRRHFIHGPAVWRLVTRRTQSYIDALADRFRDRIALNARIRAVSRREDGVTIHMDDGQGTLFDTVVFACPADRALALLAQPTADERRLLGAWKYKDGLVVVHRDDRYFPPDPMRNLYCYLYTERDGRIETSINACYKLQKGVSGTSPYLGTQHPNFPIRSELTSLEKICRTPIFDQDSVASAAALPLLNGQRRTYYCGSHFGFGLHEDAVTSAMAVAEMLKEMGTEGLLKSR